MSTVSAEVDLRLMIVTGHELSLPVSATFTYDSGDPYAVKVTFHLGLEEPVEWTFARDLLSGGMHNKSGTGDVVVWPDGDRQTVRIRLEGPDGTATFKAPAAAIACFLARTWQLVPAGREAGQPADLDSELADIIRKGTT